MNHRRSRTGKKINMMLNLVARLHHLLRRLQRKEDLAGLIASYSPAHRNWKQVGFVSGAHRHVSEAEKATCLADVQRARLHLAQSGLLLKPGN